MKSMKNRFLLLVFLFASPLWANPPELNYVFPAGGQRGTELTVRVGGMFLHENCNFSVPGLKTSPELLRTKKLWFEGPILLIPESQRQEDYPSDYKGSISIPMDFKGKASRLRVRTAQGIASGPIFMVGDLPEIIENEIDGEPIPELVKLGTTINGRIFPREDIDYWDFQATAGQTISALAYGPAVASPMIPRLDIQDMNGNILAYQTINPLGESDASIRFTPKKTGKYRLRIMDARYLGGPSYVYRVTLTNDPKMTARLINPPPGMPFSNQINLTHSTPAALNGLIQKPGQIDDWKVDLDANVKYDLQLVARQVGSPLVGRLIIMDDSGKELVREDSSETKDANLSWSAPKKGTYTIRVQDKFRNRGGELFDYQLRIDKHSKIKDRPDFRLKIASETISVLRGGTAKVRLTIERMGGFNDPISLGINGLPEQIKLINPKVNANQNSVDVQFSVPSDFHLGSHHFQLVGQAEFQKDSLTAVAESAGTKLIPESSDLEMVVGTPVPFKIVSEYVMTSANRGETYRRKYRIDRGGYNGPIEIRIAEKQARHLQGVIGPVLIIPPGQDEFDYPLFLPPWMEMGRTCRCCIMATAKIQDPIDKKEVVVSFSSTEQNQQMIVVVGPGRLGLDIPKGSLLLVSGAEHTIPVKISRTKELIGPVTVEAVIPEHWKGLEIKPITIPENQTEGLIKVRAHNTAEVWNAPLTLRATLSTKESPITAETQIDLVK